MKRKAKRKNTKKSPKYFGMNFKDFRILSLNFSINREFTGDVRKITAPYEIGVAKNYNEKEKTLRVFLKVQLKKGSPYFIEIEACGLFEFTEFQDRKVIEKVASINCPAIIFPYVRETIADLTRRAGFPPLHLPPVNFVNPVKDVKN